MAEDGNSSLGADLATLAIGAGLSLACLPGIAANLLVGWIVVRHGFLRDPKRSIYLPTLNLLCVDTGQLCLAAYFGVACAVGRRLTSEVWWEWTGFVFLLFWHNSWFSFSLIAVNRYLGVCYPAAYARLFTLRRMRVLVLGSWACSLATFTLSQFVIRRLGFCCKLIYDPAVFTVRWLPEGKKTNYTDPLVDIPGNLVTSVVLVLCYTGIVLRIRSINRSINSALSSAAAEAKRRMEMESIRFALQFLIISSVFVTAITLFRIFPILGITNQKVFALIQCLVIVNSSINSFIFIAFNKDIRARIGNGLGSLQDVRQSQATNASKTARQTNHNATV